MDVGERIGQERVIAVRAFIEAGAVAVGCDSSRARSVHDAVRLGT